MFRRLPWTNNRPTAAPRKGPAKIEPATTMTAATSWLRSQPYLVVGAGLALGITLGYWSKRR